MGAGLGFFLGVGEGGSGLTAGFVERSEGLLCPVCRHAGVAGRLQRTGCFLRSGGQGGEVSVEFGLEAQYLGVGRVGRLGQAGLLGVSRSMATGRPSAIRCSMAFSRAELAFVALRLAAATVP